MGGAQDGRMDVLLTSSRVSHRHRGAAGILCFLASWESSPPSRYCFSVRQGAVDAARAAGAIWRGGGMTEESYGYLYFVLKVGSVRTLPTVRGRT